MIDDDDECEQNPQFHMANAIIFSLETLLQIGTDKEHAEELFLERKQLIFDMLTPYILQLMTQSAKEKWSDILTNYPMAVTEFIEAVKRNSPDLAKTAEAFMISH